MPARFLVLFRLRAEYRGATSRGAVGGWASLRKLALFPSPCPSDPPPRRSRPNSDAAVGFTELFSSPALAAPIPLPLSTLGSPPVVAILIGDCADAAAAAARCRSPWEVLPRSTTFGQKSLVCEDVARSPCGETQGPRRRREEGVRGPALFARRGAMRAVALRSPSVHHVSLTADNRDPRTM